MTAQEELNYQLYLVTRRPALPLALAKDADAAAQEARALLTQGADANYHPKDGSGWSVLDGAVSSGNADIVEALVVYGAKITWRTVALVGITVERVQKDYDHASADVKDIFKQGTDAREKIAAIIFAKAAKNDFVGANWKGKTVLDHVSASPAVTALLRDAMNKHNLKDADLSPTAPTLRNAIRNKFKGPRFY